MSRKSIGWCRITEELVLDQTLLAIPYLRDHMEVYTETVTKGWYVWTPENQGYSPVDTENMPEAVRLALMMLS